MVGKQIGRIRLLLVGIVATLVLFLFSTLVFAGPLAQDPTLSVIPNSGLAGSSVTLSGSNWQSPIAATIRWDGGDRATFQIPSGGSFSTAFSIPGDAQPGGHTITVCLGAPCASGEFYVGQDVGFTVLAPPATDTPIPPPPPPTIIQFSLDANQIGAGSCTSLRWDSVNALTANLTGEFGTIPVETSGSLQVCPQVTQAYKLEIGGDAAASPNVASADVTLVVMVDLLPAATPIPPVIPLATPGTELLPGVDPPEPDSGLGELPPLPSVLDFMCSPSIDAIVLDFDDIVPGQLLEEEQFLSQGVIISISGGMRTIVPELGTITPPIAIWNDLTSIEFGSFASPVTFQFTSQQTFVGMYVGLHEVTDVEVTAELTAFDSAGNPVASSTVRLGPGPTPINTCMFVRQPGAGAPDVIPLISTVELSYDSVAGEVIDRLFFVRSSAPPPTESGDISVEIRSPADGEELFSMTQDIWGTVRSPNWVRSVDLSQVVFGVGETELFIGRANKVRDSRDLDLYVFYFRGATLDTNVRMIIARARTFEGGGMDTVRVRAVGPALPGAVGLFNVSAVAIEVTQGVRGDIPVYESFETRNWWLPRFETGVHVADRRTIVRVYPALSGAGAAGGVGGLSARLVATRDGAAMPGSPLSPRVPVLEAHPAWTLDEMRRDVNKGWLFVLPDEWVRQGTITLTVEVNPPGPYWRSECAGCEVDNVRILNNVRFEETEPLIFHPYISVGHPDSTGAPVTPTLTELAMAFDKVWRLFPLADDGLDIRRFRFIQADCMLMLPPGEVAEIVRQRMLQAAIDGTCDTLRTAHAAAGAEGGNRSGIFGTPELYPILASPLSTRGCSGRAGMPNPVYWQGACGPVLAHESWHAGGGFNHAGQAHGEIPGGGFDSSYPDVTHGAIEANAYGFDVVAMMVIPPDDGSSAHTHDIMSYGPGTRWTSIYTWNNIANWLGASSVRAQGPAGRSGLALIALPDAAGAQLAGSAALRVIGQVVDGGVRFDRGFLTTAGPGALVEGEGSYALELRDAAGSVLFVRRFEPSETHEAGGLRFIHEDLPVVSGAVELVLLRDGAEIGSLAAGANVPQVALLSPLGGARWEATGLTTLEWQASDGDGDELSYLVEASPDGGQTWWVLLQTDETRAVLDLSTVPGGGEDWRVRVQASDGLNVAVNEVAGVSVAPKPPMALITRPLEGTVFVPGESFDLLGMAADLEDGKLTDSALEWQVDGQVVGHGWRWPVFDLSLGEHTITLQATNQAGLVGQMQVNITVAEADTVQAAVAADEVTAQATVAANEAVQAAVAAGEAGQSLLDRARQQLVLLVPLACMLLLVLGGLLLAFSWGRLRRRR